MEFSRWQNFFVVLIMSAVLTSGASFALKKSNMTASIMNVVGTVDNLAETLPPLPPPEKLSNPPEIIKAVYITGYSAGTKSYLKYLEKLFKETEANAVVIDIKGSDGRVTYASGAPEVKKYGLSNNVISDIDSLVRYFHEKNIYVIGRIAVFEDPKYALSRPELAIYDKALTAKLSKTIDGKIVEKKVLWKDNNGLSWLDPASKDVWDYNISLAKDAFYHGFDEINFDYIRFPTDGNMENIGYPIYDGLPAGEAGKKTKSDVIKEFFQYLRAGFPADPSAQSGKISADLFGLTTVYTNDMGIGQLIESAFENFDYVSPMIYPSHYGTGFMGYKNPANYPYEVVKYSMDSALGKKESLLQARKNEALKKSEAFGAPAAALQFFNPLPENKLIAKLRPWIQDFNMGADYTAEMVKKEIQAVQDSLKEEYRGFMLWNPSNIYTKEAILKP